MLLLKNFGWKDICGFFVFLLKIPVMIFKFAIFIAALCLLTFTSCKIKESALYKIQLVNAGKLESSETKPAKNRKDIGGQIVFVNNELQKEDSSPTVDIKPVQNTSEYSPINQTQSGREIRNLNPNIYMAPGDSAKKIEIFSIGAFATSIAVFCLEKPFSNGYSYLLAAIALGLAILSLRRFNRNPEKFRYRIFMNIAMIVGLAFTTFLILMLLQTLVSGSL